MVNLAEYGSRESVFHDFGLAGDFKELFPYFNPTSILLQTAPQPFAYEHDLLMHGQIEEAKKHAFEKLLIRNPDEQLEYVLSATSAVHELRHFHEYIGTTAGFFRLRKVIEDAFEFQKLWAVLREIGVIELPLAAWARRADAPVALKEYMSKKRELVEWLNIFDGSTPSFEIPETADSMDAIFLFHFRGLKSSLPGVSQRFKKMSTGQIFQKIFPIGYHALTEGSAFLIQRHAASQVFGSKFWHTLGAPLPANWAVYRTVDRFLRERLGRFNHIYQLALTDIALMAEHPVGPEQMAPASNSLENGHPGWRLEIASRVAQSLGVVHDAPAGNVPEYMRKITDSLGWKNVTELADQVLKSSQKCIADIDQLKQLEFFPSLIRALENIRSVMMDFRKSVPGGFTNSWFYLSALEYLPRPPILKSGNFIFVSGSDEKDLLAFQTWIFFHYTHTRLLASKSLPCPNKDSHDCPGDPYNRKKSFFGQRKRWSPTDSCPFSKFLASFGFSDVTVKTVES